MHGERMRMGRMSEKQGRSRGFTLIEILIVIGMLAILATVVLVAINPLRQFAQARNSQRQANLSAILNAVGNRIADNRGVFGGADADCKIPVEGSVFISDQAGALYADLRPCLVPEYISELPFDPIGGSYGNTCKDDRCTDGSYNTGYSIQQTEGRTTVCAPNSLEPTLGLTQPDQVLCLTR